MNRINKLFAEKTTQVLSVYFTAGYPSRDDTPAIIEELANSGVDMIEIGMPFSDPMADGPVIQESNQQALENGMNLNLLFQQLNNIREKVSIPLVLMGYMNPVLQYGMEAFCEKCHETGIDGVILPDMPVNEYAAHHKTLFNKYDLHSIFLVTPQTSEDRIKKIAEEGSGFLYVVSSSTTTGAKNSFGESHEAYFKKISGMNLGLPFLVGFGISNHATFAKVCEYANGAIIGSAFIRALTATNDIRNNIQEFVHKIRSG
jgi:tryptophan synthase alpha chain